MYDLIGFKIGTVSLNVYVASFSLYLQYLRFKLFLETASSMEAKGLICGLPAKNEITELEFRQSCPHLGYLIRIELEEEDIDPLYKQWFRNMKKDEHNNTAKKRPREERGESSRRNL
ncbi:unnamed protein product [Arabidopsis thaliana]|uniref:(thale cress) hypothetical protein n=1 Tax=Arabidopsis thaliana TaxID=3702 RepID=A0A7G2EMT2_ARATH|nr:unnamed protein product [Arabidopsis thaliana]